MPQYGPAPIDSATNHVPVDGSGFIQPVAGGVLVKFEVLPAVGGGDKTWRIVMKDPADNETKEMTF